LNSISLCCTCFMFPHLIDCPCLCSPQPSCPRVSPAVPVHPLVLSQCTLPIADVLIQAGFINHYPEAIGAGSQELRRSAAMCCYGGTRLRSTAMLEAPSGWETRHGCRLQLSVEHEVLMDLSGLRTSRQPVECLCCTQSADE